MSHFNDKYYNKNNAFDKVFVYIHGYNGCIDDVDSSMRFLAEQLPNVMIVTPESDVISEKNSSKKQWFSFFDIDPLSIRRNKDSSYDDILSIYNLAGQSLYDNAVKINNYINRLQITYNIKDENLYIGGFSQGAMLALYTALIRENKVAGCVVNSGVVASASFLTDKIKSKPLVLLTHGDADFVVSYKTHKYSQEWLQQEAFDVKNFVMPDVGHSLTIDTMLEVAKFIKNS